MADGNWNPWKMTAIGMALVMVTALITGLVMAYWSGGPPSSTETKAETSPARPPRQTEHVASAAAPRTMAPAPVSSAKPAPAVSMQTAIDTCNQQAAASVGEQNKTTEVVKDAAVGALIGAAVGAAGGAIAGGGRSAGKGAAIGGVAGAGGGTLYGLNETKKRDEAYRIAYAHCLRARGYAS